MEKWSDILEFTKNCVNEKLKLLHEIWLEFGYDDRLIEERHESVKAHIEKILAEMVSEEQESKEKYIKSIINMYKELNSSSKELGLPVDTNGAEDMTLIQMDTYLREKLTHVREIKAEILEKYESLRKREKDVCTKLGIQHGEKEPSNIFSETDLKHYESYITSKEAEKEALKLTFTDLKSNIIAIMRELEKQPLLDFEKQVCSAVEDDFVLSKANMDKLRALYQSLESELEEKKVTSIELREKLSLLWERLHESYEVREAFLSSFPGYNKRTLDALKAEIKRCEEKKRENIKPFVQQIRDEMVDWWNKCYFGEHQKSQFLPYTSDCYNEDLLELHEEEIKRLKKYFDTNIDIIQLIQEREILWQKMLELEEKSRNKDRFKNRGGDLLKEEKERKLIQKKLPKIENELFRHIGSFEARTGEPFLYFGENVKDFIANQWDSFKENREREKLARRNDHTIIQKSITKSGTKRKLSPGPASTSKVRRVLPMAGISHVSSKPSTSTVSVGKSTLKVPESTDTTNVTCFSSYSDFKRDFEKLNQEINCRSSAVPPRPNNTPSQSTVFTAKAVNTQIPTRLLTTPIKPPRKFATPQGLRNPTTTPRRMCQVPNTGAKTCPRLRTRQRPLIL